MWSVGAFLEIDDRLKLEQYLRTNEEFRLDLPDTSGMQDTSMFDYLVDTDGND